MITTMAAMLLALAGLSDPVVGDDVPPDAVAAAAAMDNQVASPFDASRNAAADVDTALAAARTSGKHVLVVFGGGWCHDSDALVATMRQARTATMLAARYEIVWVDVPFDRSARAIPVAHRFGLGDVVGTPTVLILDSQGTPTNLADAPTWRNAASRKPAAIHRALERAAPAVGA